MIFDPALTRSFLLELIDEREFNLLCQQYFRDVYIRFEPGMNRGERIQLLIEHCDRFGRFPQLMAVLEITKPDQYKKSFHLQL